MWALCVAVGVVTVDEKVSYASLFDKHYFLCDYRPVSELVWGLTANQWAAVAAVGSCFAAIVSLFSIFVSLRLARQTQRLNMRIHRESGPYPILNIVHTHSNVSSESSHLLTVCVENRGRVAAEIKPPRVVKRTIGGTVVDSRFQFHGPSGRLRIEPSESVEWLLDIDDYPAEVQKEVVYIQVDTRACGRAYLREKVLLSDSMRLRDRLPLLWH